MEFRLPVLGNPGMMIKIAGTIQKMKTRVICDAEGVFMIQLSSLFGGLLRRRAADQTDFTLKMSLKDISITPTEEKLARRLRHIVRSRKICSFNVILSPSHL